MNKNYETVIIFTPVLNEEEVKKQIKKYVDLIKDAGGNIVHENHWGMRQMAYPIQKKTTGIYHIVEYNAPGSFIDGFELQFRRDENVIRFLTIALDKFALDYNDRKRNGLIGKKKAPKIAQPVDANVTNSTSAATATAVAPPPTEVVEKVETPAAVEAPRVAEPAVEAAKIETPTVDTERIVEPNSGEPAADADNPSADTNIEPEKTDET